MVCWSCAIHDKFPYICFYPQCVKQQFSLKPLKRNLQLALGNKKRSKSSSQKKNKAAVANTKQQQSKNEQDSVIVNKEAGLSQLDTVIRIYYHNLNDSLIRVYNKLIQSFVNRVGANRISEVVLTDVYADNGTDALSRYQVFFNSVNVAGVFKHKIFKARNHYLKPEGNLNKPGKLLYLEIRFH